MNRRGGSASVDVAVGGKGDGLGAGVDDGDGDALTASVPGAVAVGVWQADAASNSRRMQRSRCIMLFFGP